MKKFLDKGCFRVVGIILAVVYLPVLFCVIFVGNNMKYSDGLKIELLCHNAVLFLIALPFLFLAVYLMKKFGEKPLEQKENRIANIALTAACIAVYFVTVWIAREIVYRLPWDIGTVRVEAMKLADDIPVGYNYYFSIYSNNIPMVYVLGKIFRFAKENLDTRYGFEFFSVQINCVLMTLSLFFSCQTVKRMTDNLAAVAVTFITGFCLIGLSAWKIAAYTDTYGQAFPVMGIYFYICARQTKATWKKILYSGAAVLLMGAGGFMKPNLFVILIAFFIAELIEFLRDVKKTWFLFLLMILFMSAALYAVHLKSEKIIGEIGLEFNADLEAGPAEYFYMGLNEDTTGSYSGEDAAVYGEFQFSKRAEREKIVFLRALDRLKEKGVFGAIYFWVRKLVMSFNDGLFGWRTEAWVAEYYDPPIDGGTRWTAILRGIYWGEGREVEFNTVCQMIWILVLIGIPGICFQRSEPEEQVEFLLAVCFLGIVLYQMLFEARARYLFAFLPVIIAVGTAGMHQYSLLWQEFCGKRMK